MSLFGSLMADVEEDPFFMSHMRQMRQMSQMNNFMNSMFSDPFGMLGGGPLAIGGSMHGSSMMPFMPPMPNLNRLFTGLESGGHGMGSSFTSTVVMSSGPNGKPQVYSSTSSTKIGPNGVKETRKTLEDSRTGTKKMSIGHHIGERAHVIEREQNVYTGDAEENQEYINLEEDDAEEFDREFQMKAGAGAASSRRPLAIAAAPARHARDTPRLTLPAPPPQPPHHSPTPYNTSSDYVRRHQTPTSRRPIRTSTAPFATSSASVRETYSAAHPQRRKHRPHRSDH